MAVVTSGTATLETAIMRVPQVVVYRVNFITYYMIKMLIRVKFISLVNLIGGSEIVKELIQNDFTPANLRQELSKLKMGEPERLNILRGYDDVIQKIGKAGASEKTAELMIGYLKKG
jgi:lipid-A-disaccharide synthase